MDKFPLALECKKSTFFVDTYMESPFTLAEVGIIGAIAGKIVLFSPRTLTAINPNANCLSQAYPFDFLGFKRISLGE